MRISHGMDEPISDDVAEPVGNKFLLKPGTSSMLASNEMVTPGTDDYPDILDPKNLDRITSSEHANASPHCMVEELTLRNYEGENLTLMGSSNRRNPFKEKGHDRDENVFSGLLNQNPPLQNHNHNAIMDNLMSSEDKGTATGDVLYSSGGIRTKILSKSGFSEYFIKSTLRGKGEIRKSPASNHVAPMSLTLSKPVSEQFTGLNSSTFGDGITLREWLETGRNKTNKAESLQIFRRALDCVDLSHSQGVCLQELRPSHFKLTGANKIVYIGSPTRDKFIRNEKGTSRQSTLPMENLSGKKRKMGKSIQRWPQFPSRSGNVSKNVSAEDSGTDVDEDHNSKNSRKLLNHNFSTSSQPLHASVSCSLEEKWYTSPELLNEKSCCTFASNIYSLGILLFELLGSFDSVRSHAGAMHDISHRILPPSFLSENPKEAGFCLWLLHPEPSLRPTSRDILQSEFVSGIQELPGGGELLSSIDEQDGESDLLLYFLSSLNEQKQKNASNLEEQIQRIESDIQEVEKRRPKRFTNIPSASGQETRLMNNIRQLENAYFSMRSKINLSDSGITRDGEILKSRENWCTTEEADVNYPNPDRLGGFFEGLCKYARYSKFKVRGILRNGEFSSSANVICSLSFDRDEEYLAAGVVSKKIKIFEFQSLFNDSVDIHYPAVEMANKSKLSCICWNSYIRNYIASTDYDGTVKLWDASTGQGFSQFNEHSERAWSVDFSRVDPMKLASGSDDRLVKLWSINEKNSLCTIRANANVCSVQFSPESAHLLAFSSADYKTYCYDIRNTSTPWCVLAGHEKAVSYAKFLDSGTLVTASTDNTLKVWDLNKTSSNFLSRDACVLTLKGHTNEKNFVGLSVGDGYITCGSETNEVFAYHKSLPMPITAHKFGSIDPITGKETEDDNGQFVSSVCWRKKSNMVVAANSSGCIKLLQMV